MRCHCTRNVDSVSQTVFRTVAAILRKRAGYETSFLVALELSKAAKHSVTASMAIPRLACVGMSLIKVATANLKCMSMFWLK